MKKRVFFSLILAAFLFCIMPTYPGLAAEKGWREGKNFSGRNFDFGSTSIASIDASNDLRLSPFSINNAVLVSDLLKKRVQARGFATGNTVAHVGAENVRTAKAAGKKVLLLLVLGEKSTLGGTLFIYTGARKPEFIVLKPAPVTVQGTYGDEESAYAGIQAELTPLVDRFLDLAFREINKYGVKP